VNPGASSDPAEILLDREQRALSITWKDGHRSVYAFDDLRRDCPCASCDETRKKPPARTGLQVISGPVVKRGEAQVTDYRAIGWYALSFTWNDGHDTGIYSYEFLRARCACEQCRPGGRRPRTGGGTAADRGARHGGQQGTLS
jgi:DUF971 family protein